jgi:hypothetical protein
MRATPGIDYQAALLENRDADARAGTAADDFRDLGRVELQAMQFGKTCSNGQGHLSAGTQTGMMWDGPVYMNTGRKRSAQSPGYVQGGPFGPFGILPGYLKLV